MVNYYPLISEKEVTLKKLDNQIVVFIDSLQEKKITLNESAKFIFDKCNGEKSIKEIIELFSENYDMKSYNENIAKEDVFNTLKTFDKYGFISWKYNQNPFIRKQVFDDLKIYKVGLSSLDMMKQKFDFIIYDEKFERNIINDKSTLSNIIFLNLIQIYFIEKKNTPSACIIFNATETNYIWQLSKFSFNENFDLNTDFAIVLNYVSAELKKEFYKATDNIKLGFFVNVEKKNLMNCRNMGFVEKGKLKYELENEIYSMWIMK